MEADHMSFTKWDRTLVAGILLVLAGLWTSTRVAAFQLRMEAERAFWSGRREEALRKYRLLEHFGPSERKARTGQLEVFLSLMESQRGGPKPPSLSEETMRSQLENVVRD